MCVCVWGGGGVDVHARMKIHSRSTPSVGRLTVLHVVGVVRSQDAWSDRSIKETLTAA